ncbi:MAG: methionine--tRNA ligase [Acidobacteriia bacterium]|nr:methionine--tRNA ligase [Terriglobia bacterium]
MRRFYLTTPIYYPNARPHVGSAYTTIVCDVIARYKRMCGYDVAFLTGTDEHGEKLERAATAAGKSPGEFVAEERHLFVELWKKLGMSVSVYPDAGRDSLRFIYTTHPDHRNSVRRMLLRAKDKGYISKRLYEGRYCVSDERYISDGAEPADCDICGRPAELIREENYFFRLSAFQERLLELYETHPEFVQPDFRRNEVVSFVRSGLRDISVSRKRIKWGIPFPLDAERDDPEQVVYVWYDALTSYLTGIGYAQGENGGPDFRKYWMGAEGPAEVVHMIGKDILRFHAVYWPAFLMAADLPLPKTIFAHGWIYYEQDKMSKSKGNVVYPEPILGALESFGAPGNDALRYYLLREAPFGQDMSFSYEGLIQRYNSDLANDLGNLAARTLTMLHQYFGGVLPETPEPLGAGSLPQHQFAAVGNATVVRWRRSFDSFDFSGGLEAVWQLVSLTNRYLGYTQPWVMAGDASKQDRLASILRTSAETLRLTALLLYPVLPLGAQELWEQLGRSDPLESYQGEWPTWDAPSEPTGLKPGAKVGKPEPIFPRLDKEKTLAKLDELAEADRERDKANVRVLREVPPQIQHNKPKETKSMESQSAKPPSPDSGLTSPAAEKISIEDFAKVDMRVGEILTAEPVAGAQKLTKLTVDIGSEVRQVVAGIAEYYKPEQLVGMKVVIVANLQSRKLRGVESNGMIVAATVGSEGRPVLVTFKEEVEVGAKLK